MKVIEIFNHLDKDYKVLIILACVGILLFVFGKWWFEELKKVFEILLILAVIWYGHVLSDSYKEKELALEYLKFSIEILNKPIGKEGQPIREWALAVFDKYADPPLTVEQKYLLTRLPAASFIMTQEEQKMTEDEIKKILENDGGYQKHLDAI